MIDSVNWKTNEKTMLWITLHRISDQISKHEDKLFRKTHLTKAEHRILLTMAFLIEDNKAIIKITDLLPFQNSSLVSISLIIGRMVKKGLIKKVRDRSDRRVVRIIMTPKGEKLLKESSNPTTELINKIFSVYSEAELKTATHLMNKLLEVVEAEMVKENTAKLAHEYRLDFLNKFNES